tara:strand:- start:476 stop:682 length:207 start_codon:yes stop_codon:yes gene_type:complete
MDYILNVSGRELKLIRASIVNFSRSLAISQQADFSETIEELDDCFLSITEQKRLQLQSKINKKWIIRK